MSGTGQDMDRLQREIAESDPKAVYVDQSIYPYGRMVMCHMGSRNLDALHAMATRIGVARKWFQNKASFPHYDICKSKRADAVRLGAVEVDKYGMVALARQWRAENGGA